MTAGAFSCGLDTRGNLPSLNLLSSSTQGFQQEITLNTNKIDQLIVFGEQLIQKSEPLDAALIEDELEELHRYCQEVFGRVSRFHRRLTARTPVRQDSTAGHPAPPAQGVHWTCCSSCSGSHGLF